MDRHTQGREAPRPLPPTKAMGLLQACPPGRENTAGATHPHAHLARQPRLSRLPLHTQDKQHRQDPGGLGRAPRAAPTWVPPSWN